MKSNNTALIILVGAVILAVLFSVGTSKKIDGTTLFSTSASSTVQTENNDNDNGNHGRYANPNFAFSFIPPTGFTVTSFDDTDQAGTSVTTVIVDDKAKSKGAQIIISPWDESPDTLTSERIKRDIPSMHITDVAVRDVANIGTVIEFTSDSADFGGKSHEAWFVAHGDLYQMSTYAENGVMIDTILATWKFQE